MHLVEMFERGLVRSPDGACFVDTRGGSLTYREVDALAHRIANGLRAAGIVRGEHVGLLSANHLLTFVSVLGTIRSPGVWMPVNARNAIEESINVLARGHCRFLFVHSDFAPQLARLREAIPQLKGIVCIDREIEGAPALADWAARQDATPVRVQAEPDDVVAVRGTGGTTGLPRGVLNTHRMYAALFENWYAHMPADGAPPVHLVVAPLTHAAGTVTFATLGRGGTNVILDNADPQAILEAIERHRVTQLFLPPTVIYRLLAHPAARTVDASSLRYFIYSAAPMSVERLREALDLFGPVMVQCYGQAEAPFIATCLTPEDHTRALEENKPERLASCGRASPFVKVGIMDPEGRLLGPGERGEIVVQGDLVMRGYYEDPEATAKTLRDGWLHTGDVGMRDADGYFYIVDRLKDLIITGGFNVSPGEVEQVLWALPEVADCAVVGVPDPDWGESVKAVVELKPGASLDIARAIAHCRERLGGIKSPKTIDVWPALPRSPVGKVLKKEIRERYWKDQARRV